MLSRRELESRFEVWVEQYVISANIEAETDGLDRPHDAAAGGAAPPGAPRRGGHGGPCERGPGGRSASSSTRSSELEQANVHPDAEGLDLAVYVRDTQLTAMAKVREIGDQLEKVVADDLWPLPKYSEMLFIK